MVLPLLRTRLRRVVFVSLVGVPVAGVGGLAAYVQYRQRTRPQRHIFRPVVDDEGNLLLADRVVPRPSTRALFVRTLQLLCIFVPVALLYLVARLRASWYRAWLRCLLAAVQRAGPVFIKIGQWSCTREDIFSRDVRDVFKQLYNAVDVHPYADTLRVLREELGTGDEEDVINGSDSKRSRSSSSSSSSSPGGVGVGVAALEHVAATTVGSGSIGQVHLAQLRGSRRRVVVKVMHPNIIETIVLDFTLLNRLAQLLHRHVAAVARYDFPALARAFTNHLAAQLDFRIEADNLTQFRRNFRHEHYVEFPEPIVATQRVLIETFCDGQPANPEFLATLPPHARDALAAKGLNTWCQMLLRDNFVHGDMHPGNILIDCSDPHEPTITLIDVGLCQQLSEDEADLSRSLMESFVKWNAALCASCIWRMSSTQHYGDEGKFTDEMTDLFRRFRPTRNEEQAVTRMLQGIFDCIRVNRVQMDPPYVSLLFSVLVLESFIMNLNPHFNIVRHTAPWLVSEGFVSKGVAKNVCKAAYDRARQELHIARGHACDAMQRQRWLMALLRQPQASGQQQQQQQEEGDNNGATRRAAPAAWYMSDPHILTSSPTCTAAA